MKQTVLCFLLLSGFLVPTSAALATEERSFDILFGVSQSGELQWTQLERGSGKHHYEANGLAAIARAAPFAALPQPTLVGATVRAHFICGCTGLHSCTVTLVQR